MLVRHRAVESVKLQQPGDKSFSLPLPASASEGYSRGVKPGEGETNPGCLLSLEPPASPDQQASNHKRTAGQDTLTDTYTAGLTQLTRGPPNPAEADTHSCSLLGSHTLAVSLSSTVSNGSIQPCLSGRATASYSPDTPHVPIHAPCVFLRGTRRVAALVLTFAAVLCGVRNCPSLDAESLWLCSTCTSVQSRSATSTGF